MTLFHFVVGSNFATSVPPAGGPTILPLGRGSSRAKVVSNPNLTTSAPPVVGPTSVPPTGDPTSLPTGGGSHGEVVSNTNLAPPAPSVVDPTLPPIVGATSVPPTGDPTSLPTGGGSPGEAVSNTNLITSVPPASSSSSLPTSEGSRVENDRRKVISVEAISTPFVPQTVICDIISTVIMRMPTPAERWKDYPGDMKDELFNEFMGKYTFASDFDRNMARTVWERTCMDLYPDHLKNARVAALKQVNSTNLVDTKGRGPKGMKTEVWNGLVDIWLRPEWKRKSDAGRSNRASIPDSMMHTGGSISFSEHKKRMEAELKHPVSYRDVFDRVHKKKDGEYVSKHSKNFIDSYDMAMLKKYGEDSSVHPMIDSEVWAEVIGPNKKRRVLGGHSLDIDIHGSMATSYSTGTGPSRIMAPIQEDVKEAVNVAMTSFVQTHLVPMLEPILSKMVDTHVRNLVMQAQMQDIF
ncbi:putative transposase, Ptta/En/Spm, plant [Sesbania bispinosa]|nr:putative transposase, Ptta/En/Spm, plant [Sesbania bispinosa]